MPDSRHTSSPAPVRFAVADGRQGTLQARPGQDAVALQLEHGPRLLLHPDTAAELLAAQSATPPALRGAAAIAVPARLSWQGLAAHPSLRAGATLGHAVLSSLDVVRLRVRDGAASLLTAAVTQHVDGQVEAGVYALQPQALERLKGSGLKLDRLPAGDQPLLVLVHGTFVETQSTWAPLWQQPDGIAQALFRHYGSVYALDHPTLAASPIANALTLARALPDGARLHLATHSRGGLVAEVLARVCAEPSLDEATLARHFSGAHAGEADELRALAQAVRGRGIRVERIVRVACPARGTLLASRRLDAYLSVFHWLLSRSGMPVLPALMDLLQEVARRRADPAELPGLEAMMPSCPLIRWLHDAPAPLPGELRVVAGEVQGDSLTSWLKTLLSDAFYWTDNDLVVQTRSMYGGARRAPGHASFLLDSGGEVDHFHYFANPRTAQALRDALLLAQPPGFSAIGPQSWAGADSAGQRAMLASPFDAAQPAGAAREQPAPPAAPLRLEVLNTHLRQVRAPLMLGHYRAMKLTGTEAVVDRLLGGALREAKRAGLYADELDTHQVFSPRHSDGPAAVIVVGLGEEGKLRASDLQRAVRQATLAYAQRIGEQLPPHAARGRGPSTLEIAATLLGSGGTGITVGTAAQAIAQGVREANQRLLDAGWPRVATLTFVELYLDRATEAWVALDALRQSAPAGFQLGEVVQAGPGALRRPLDSGYRGAQYDFVSAISVAGHEGESLIEYTLDTRRARAEVRGQSAQRTLVQELIGAAADERRPQPELGRALFQLLVPSELEPFLAGSGDTLLELDAATAAIPWELLDTRPDGEAAAVLLAPWAIRARLLRKLRTPQFRRQPQGAGADGGVLVIGEPAVDDPDYPPLPGARAEAEAVAAALQVPALLGAQALQVINALLGDRYRVVHVAGHGSYAPDGSGGVVLSNHAVLGPREIESMRTVPELVFVNCCHLGKVEAAEPASPPHHRVQFAANVAEQLIRLGVRCVIAAGWAVDDEPAQRFATVFYEQLLKGARFMDAVATARELAWREHPQSITWAAYQCYGDPDWVYVQQIEADLPPRRAAVPPAIVSSPALALALETLAIEAGHGDTPHAQLLEQVRQLEAQHGERWGMQGAVAEAFGLAYAETGDRAAARRWYRAAVKAPDGSASMRAAERLKSL